MFLHIIGMMLKSLHSNNELPMKISKICFCVFALSGFMSLQACAEQSKIMDGEYLSYTPTSGQAFIKDGIYYYEGCDENTDSRLPCMGTILESNSKPIFVMLGVIKIDGNYQCHESITRSAPLGTCTKTGWQPYSRP